MESPSLHNTAGFFFLFKEPEILCVHLDDQLNYCNYHSSYFPQMYLQF